MVHLFYESENVSPIVAREFLRSCIHHNYMLFLCYCQWVYKCCIKCCFRVDALHSRTHYTWFITAMCPSISHQDILQGYCIVANSTFKWFLSTMSSAMCRKALLFRLYIVANMRIIEFLSTMSSQIFHQFCHSYWCRVAHNILKRSLFIMNP